MIKVISNEGKLMQTVTKIIVSINDLENLNTLLKKSLLLANKVDAVVEILYVYEAPLFELPDFFKKSDKTLDKEAIKKEIQCILKQHGFFKNIAIFIYIDDTINRLKHLIDGDKNSLIVTTYHKTITPKIIKHFPQTLLVKHDREYKNIVTCIDSKKSFERCLLFTKQLFSDLKNFLIYEYHYIVDPTMEADLQNFPQIESLKREEFEAIKKESGLDGEFFLDGSFDEMELKEYINNNNFDLALLCLYENNSLFHDVDKIDLLLIN